MTTCSPCNTVAPSDIIIQLLKDGIKLISKDADVCKASILKGKGGRRKEKKNRQKNKYMLLCLVNENKEDLRRFQKIWM